MVIVAGFLGFCAVLRAPVGVIPPLLTRLGQDLGLGEGGALPAGGGRLSAGRATLVDAFDAERTRIAREIHDGVGHLLTRLLLQVKALQVVHREEPGVVADLTTLDSGLDEALDSMRRSVHALSDDGEELATSLNLLGSRCGIDSVSVDCSTEAEPPAVVARCVVAVVREALTNAASYAGVSIPILPGVIPLTDLRRLTRLEALTGVRVPTGLRSSLGSASGATLVERGIGATLDLATALLRAGAPGLHLYTFNRTRPALDVISHLRLGGILAGAAPDREVRDAVDRGYLQAPPGRLEAPVEGPGQAQGVQGLELVGEGGHVLGLVRLQVADD